MEYGDVSLFHGADMIASDPLSPTPHAATFLPSCWPYQAGGQDTRGDSCWKCGGAT